ncbi:MAG: TrkH family potassium uptake protein [Alphaproteobacteria bacterium]
MSEAPIFRPAIYVCGVFCSQLAAAMLVPAAVDAIDRNPDWRTFTESAIIVGFLSVTAMLATRSSSPKFTLRFAFFAVVLIWVVTAIAGALPFWMSGRGMSFTDSVFESMSGITTTGSTVIIGLDEAPRGLLLWRSMLQWIGGIGFVAMGLLMLPFLRVGGMQFFRIESSDRSDKPFPRFLQFSTALVMLYFGLTVACGLGYVLAGMPVFEAVNHAMTTLSTGGFSTHDYSLGHYQSDAILWVAVLFMVIGSLPFTLYIRALFISRATSLTDPQIVLFLALVAVIAASMATWLSLETGRPFLSALTQTTFHVVSIITTTGYAAGDYTTWGHAAVGMFLMLTMVGGCAGSTAGGLKSYRLLVMFELLRSGLTRLLYPHGVLQLRYGGRTLEPDILRSVNVFLTAFLFSLVALTLGLAFTGVELVTALTGAMTALANVGPGLGREIGPAGNFATLNEPAKWLLTVGMLLGRLEIMSVLVLFSPAFWRG